MLLGTAAVVCLAGVLPVAAAGSIAPLTRPWIRKITSWMLALSFYKPAAAAVYAVAFTMIGSGRDPRTVLMGFVMLLLSVIALPALMKFFTWTTGTIAGSGGGGQLLGAAAVGAVAVGTMRSPGGGAARPLRALRPARHLQPRPGELLPRPEQQPPGRPGRRAERQQARRPPPGRSAPLPPQPVRPQPPPGAQKARWIRRTPHDTRP